MTLGRKSMSVHRATYLTLVGAVPAGMHLDHLCRVRTCCNPDHLEPVTPRENGLRSPFHGLKTHCANGHEFTPENTLWQRGRSGHKTRRCRICRRAQETRCRRAAEAKTKSA